MRPADINRTKRALDHIDRAMKQMDGIRYENVSSEEYTLRQSVNRHLQDTKWVMEDLVRIGGGTL